MVAVPMLYWGYLATLTRPERTNQMNDNSALSQLRQTVDQYGDIQDRLFAANQLLYAAVMIVSDLRSNLLVELEPLAQAIEITNQATSRISSTMKAARAFRSRGVPTKRGMYSWTLPMPVIMDTMA